MAELTQNSNHWDKENRVANIFASCSGCRLTGQKLDWIVATKHKVVICLKVAMPQAGVDYQAHPSASTRALPRCRASAPMTMTHQ
jgi:heterodisulfide reductase subunit B